jgi:hypothetical protein
MAKSAIRAERKIERVFYSRSTDRVRIIFDDRTIYVVPRRLLEGLENAAAQELRRIEILDAGPRISWPLLGVTHNVPALLSGIYGSKRWMASLDRAPKAASPRHAAREAEKAAASRTRGFFSDKFAVMTNARAAGKKRRPR